MAVPIHPRDHVARLDAHDVPLVFDGATAIIPRMTTEIYSCKDGQSLKQGKLDYDSSITSREDAQSDALRRCQRDPTLKKIAYYKVSPDGEFRVFHSYTNPNCKPAGTKPAGSAASKPRPMAKKPPPKLGFFGKLKKSLGI